ncbi:MAG: DUF3524 domain-containing protein, partial [Planctomycetota bacterium]
MDPAPSRRNILVLNAYHGGSHAVLVDSMRQHSRHALRVLGLPAKHWGWRMRVGGLQFVDELSSMPAGEIEMIEGIWTTSMLDLVGFRGLAAGSPSQTIRRLANLPVLVYFHENQMTYPASRHQRTDLHYGYTQIQTAMAAQHVAFNSEFHRVSFFDAARATLRRMPDARACHNLDCAKENSSVLPPGAQWPGDDPDESEHPRRSIPHGPIRIGWVSRWEHDKRPDLFVRMIHRLADAGHDFRLILLGRP